VQTRFVYGPSYLNIQAINSQLKWDSSIGGSWSTGGGGSITPTISYSEQPTITYVPLSGEPYVKQIMTPIGLKTMLLFLSAGWTIGDVFSVVVQRLGPESNGLLSNPSSQGDMPVEVTRFRRMMKIMTQLQLSHKLALSTLAGNKWPKTKWAIEGNNVTEFTYESNAQMPLALNFFQELMLEDDPDHQAFMDLLSILQFDPDLLEESNEMYPERLTLMLSNSAFPTPLPGLKIQTRSFHQMLWNLSFAVDVPSEYIENGWVYVLRDQDGELRKKEELYGGILNVRCSETRPAAAAIEIEYDYWYYIDNSDLASKTTFVLLGQMVQMQSSPESAAPKLTINAG
jgi:hypothetical protein